MDTEQEGGSGMKWDSSTDMYTLPCIKQLVGSCCIAQGAQPNALWWRSGWEWGGGRLKRERMYIHRQLIHIIVQQKLTQYFKATVFQFKFFKKLKKKTLFIYNLPPYTTYLVIDWRNEEWVALSVSFTRKRSQQARPQAIYEAQNTSSASSFAMGSLDSAPQNGPLLFKTNKTYENSSPIISRWGIFF